MGTAQVLVSNSIPPTLSLTSPADGATYTAPANISLAATATPGTNAIKMVQFYHDGMLLNTDTTSPYSFNWTNVGAGTYQVTAVVTDSQGLSNTSNIAHITVNTAPPPPPSSGGLPNPVLDLPNVLPINATIALQNAASYSGATFNWTFTPIAGNAQSVVRQENGALPFAAATVSAASAAPQLSLVSVPNLSPGTYAITVQAQNGSQTSNTATATVTLVSADLSAVQVYPNPWRSDKHAGKSVTFANLPAHCTIKLFTVSGHKVKEFDNINGTQAWDLTNDSGDKVASGIYIYLITDSQGNKVRGKVAVIK